MEFFTVSKEPRPVRLSEATRVFAYESLHHKYGQDTEKTPAALLDHIPDFSSLPPLAQHDRCIEEIVKQAPIRICPGERLSGAATLGLAIEHKIPATFRGETIFDSVSHLTLDFHEVLRYGVDSMEAHARRRLEADGLSAEQQDFLKSCLTCMDALRLWHGRYLEALKADPDYRENYQNLCRVPFGPARTFHEAVQCIWFIFAFVRLCGNWPGIGRIDVLLGDYLKKDLAEGVLTLSEAREILAHLFIKGCEWIRGGDRESGDAQHYQNLVLAGVDENGKEVTNEVTYLVLDILEELNISDFPTTLRLNASTDDGLLRRAAQVLKHGGGVLAFYNEDGILRSLTDHGYSLQEARRFANDGCWEIQVPGKTCFSYVPFDGLRLLLNDAMGVDGEGLPFSSMAELKDRFYRALESCVENIVTDTLQGLPWRKEHPCTVVSLFEQSCIEKAASYFAEGTDYTVVSPHLGGAADVGNCLYSIDRLCFIEKRVTPAELIRILQNNWEGEEVLRQYALHRLTYYGNDNDEADAYTAEVADRFAQIVLAHDGRHSIRFVPGISTFGRQIEWRVHRCATPHGHRVGDILAPNMSATPGTDLAGATALIRSYCKLDLQKQVNGAALDLKLLPSSVKGEAGTLALMGLLRGFVALGGCFVQPDVVDNEILKEAQLHPEDYQFLSVRVSGWNARFVTLNREWQDMCIEKSTHGEL